MATYRGLNELYELFKEALYRNQEFLDPNYQRGTHPNDVAIFEYTLNFKEFKMRGDITKDAMSEFCRIIEHRASQSKINNLFDNNILTYADGKLRLSGHADADGFYVYEKK